MDPGLRKVTLAQYLSHTSGVPGDNDAFEDLVDESMTRDGNLDRLRRLARRALERAAARVESGGEVRLCEHELCHRGTMLERSREDLGGTGHRSVFSGRSTCGRRGSGRRPRWARSTPRSATARLMARSRPISPAPTATTRRSSGPPGPPTCRCSTSPAGPDGRPARGGGPKLVRPETLRKLHTTVISMTIEEAAPAPLPAADTRRLGTVCPSPGPRSRSSSTAARTATTSPISGSSRRPTSRWSSSRTSAALRLKGH